jgi:hypothetical protein
MRLFVKMLLIGMLAIASGIAVAQEDSVTVPDVTGMNAPLAASELNRAGLNVGNITAIEWTADSSFPQNTVGDQFPKSGETVTRASSVDLVVLSSPNALAIYDDNDLTLVNQTGGLLSLGGISFVSLDGNSQTLFRANRWSGSLENGDCGQVWSVGRNGAKAIDECGSISWLTTNDSAQHFWTGANGATQFAVLQDGVQRGVCPIVNPGRCQFFLAAAAQAESTEYVYLAYTREQFLIFNQSADKWMALGDVKFGNETENSPLVVESLFMSPSGIGNYTQLAPGQCIMYTNQLNGPFDPLQSCDVIGVAFLNQDPFFADQGFSILSATDALSHRCPGATEGRLTVCILPR